MEVSDSSQEKVVHSITNAEAVIEGSNMNDKLEFHEQSETVKFDSADDAVCINEVVELDTVTVETDVIGANVIFDDESNSIMDVDLQTPITKDINLQNEIPQDTAKVDFPSINLNLCQIMSYEPRQQNTDNSFTNKFIGDELVLNTTSTVNFEDKTTSQWDTKVLDSVANNELVCSEIENYLKNNLNLPNSSRREGTKVDLTSRNVTNELFKTTSEISDTNYNTDKVDVSSIETTIFDKLASSQNKLDFHPNINFGQCESSIEMINILTDHSYVKSVPICFAGVTTCESLEKNERMKAKDEVITDSHSNNEKPTEHLNNCSENSTKPTSTIDFLSGSFRNEETSECVKEKNKNRNILRNIVVAKLSEAQAENIKEFEPNKNASIILSNIDTKTKESDIAITTATVQPEKVTESAMKLQMELLNKKQGQVWSSDSEGDSYSSSDRSSYNSSTCDNSDDSCSTISMISKTQDGENASLKKWREPKTKGELGLEDLPPIEDLFISVQEKELEDIGNVSSIVEELVIVQGNKDQPALDLDSVLFLEGGKPLGKIFDVFGPVVQPSYAIRFNSNNKIIEKGITKGCTVYSAPSHTDITKYVFAEKLRREKGSDASWENNNEPPDQHIDYSDDEKEKSAKKKKQTKPRTTLMRNAFSQQNQVPSVQIKNEKLHTVNGTSLRPPLLQIPRLPPPPPHPGFPYGPPPPLPPFASRYPATPIFGAMPELAARPSFTGNSSNNSIPFTFSTPPPPLPPGTNRNSNHIPFCISSPPPPPPPCNKRNNSIPFSIPSPLSIPLSHPPPIPPSHPPGNPLSNSMYCLPPPQHNIFGPYGTALPSFSGNTDIASRPLVPPSRIGAPSVAPFPPPPFGSSLPIAPRPQFS